MKTIPTLLAAALAIALAGCQQNETPVRTSAPTSGASTPDVQATAPAAQPDRDTPPKETPATHAGAPQTDAPATATARDTPANRPTGELTASEEAKTMPKPGQTNNHFTTAIEGEVKGTQQSSGSPSAAPASGAPAAPSK
jgi:hypothetical protein